ncbi:hypothetical protein ABZ894_04660 [Nocardia beijingensis]
MPIPLGELFERRHEAGVAASSAPLDAVDPVAVRAEHRPGNQG